MTKFLVFFLFAFSAVLGRSIDDSVIFKGLPREMGQWHAGDTVKIHYRFKASKSAISPEETDFYLDDTPDAEEYHSVSFRLPSDLWSSKHYELIIRKRGWMKNRKVAESHSFPISSKRDADEEEQSVTNNTMVANIDHNNSTVVPLEQNNTTISSPTTNTTNTTIDINMTDGEVGGDSLLSMPNSVNGFSETSDSSLTRRLMAVNLPAFNQW